MRDSTRAYLARRDAEVEQVRARALAQGLARFPADGRGPLTVDRYDWPSRTLAELVRTCRETPIVRRIDGSVRVVREAVCRP